MSTWLEQLERELDKRLSEFLRNNPVQDQLCLLYTSDAADE